MIENSYALVTGASSGIGLELAKLLAKDGYNLVLIARSEDKLYSLAKELKQTYKINIKVIVQDLSLDNAAQEICDKLTDENIQVDVLINNAGFGGKGKFADTDLDYELGMMQVNMNVLVILTKYFLREMLKKKYGKILNVASTAAFAPGPFMSIYYATKAFVLSFSEAIGNELKGTDVTVTALCPGPTDTGFQKQAGVKKSNMFSAINVMDAETVAKIGYKGMKKGKRVVIPGFINKLLIFLERFTPRNLVTSTTRWMQENRK